jgi:hypothetical protein
MGDLEYFLWEKEKSRKRKFKFPKPCIFKSLKKLNKLGIGDLLLRI